jgi:hypothetical protein
MNLSFKIVYTAVVLICLLLNLIFYFKSRKSFFLIGALYFLMVALMDTKLKLLYQSFKFENYHYNIYVTASLILFYLMFRSVFKEGKWRTVFKSLTAVALVLIVTTMTRYGFHVFHTNTKIIFVLYVCILSLLTLLSISWKPDLHSIFRKEHFWMSIGLLIWSTSSIFRFLPADSFHAKEPHFLELVQIGFNIVNILTYVLFLVGILCKGFQSK